MAAAEAPGPAKADPASAKAEAAAALRETRRRRSLGKEGSGGGASLEPEIEEAEDWVVSYMDMVTLLMTVFLGMLAIVMLERKFDPQDARVPPQAVAGPATAKSALPPPAGGPGALADSGATPPGTPLVQPGEPATGGAQGAPAGKADGGQAPPRPERAWTSLFEPPPDQPAPRALPPAAADPPLAPESRKLLDKLAKAGLPPDVVFGTKDRQVTIQISDKILFASGQAELAPQGVGVIRQIVPVLAALNGVISVEGHTDDVPIATARFPSNWDLSAARASAVARLLEAEGINRNRLRAIGYADTRPVALPPAGRSLNRRVTLVVEP